MGSEMCIRDRAGGILVDCFVGRLVGWLVIGWYVGCLVGWLVGGC